MLGMKSNNNKRCIAKGGASQFVYKEMSIEQFCRLVGKALKETGLAGTTNGYMLTPYDLFTGQTGVNVVWVDRQQFINNYIVMSN